MIYGYDPRTGETVGDALPETDPAGVDMIVSAAAAAGAAWRATPVAERALALEAVADALTAHADELWELADRETALGEVRLRGEVGRTAGQFRLFAQVIRDGGYLEAIVDHADASATPPRPDVRRMKQPLPGVVAVFAASNFPFAFSVAGGDTVSALAAGCPVVVKAHPGHPHTSVRVARIVRDALSYPDLLGLVHGMRAGAELVQHPGVVAAGFTGSIAGGKAIQKLIDERETPIPFFGELGSVNPVVVLPSAPKGEVARGFAASLTLGVGQFCTNPGLLFVPEDDELRTALVEAVEGTKGGPMLAERIRDGYVGGLERLGDLRLLAEGKPGEGGWAVTPKVFTTDVKSFADKLPGIAGCCRDLSGSVRAAACAGTARRVADRHRPRDRPRRGGTDRRGAGAQGGQAHLERLAHRGGRHLGHASWGALARRHLGHHLGRCHGHRPLARADGLPGLAGGFAAGRAQG